MGRLVGYAKVIAPEQSLDLKDDELKAAGRTKILTHKKYKYFLIIAFFLFPDSGPSIAISWAQNSTSSKTGILYYINSKIEANKIYIVDADFNGISLINSKDTGILLKRGTKIYIKEITNEEPKKYYFRPTNSKSCENQQGACENKIYYFTSEQKANLYLREWCSISHGTLVVPFKYRTKDGRLTGDSTIGYYFGKKIEWHDLDFIPLISFGISAISTPFNETDTDTELGVSAALGVILKHSGNFQTGIVCGIDHIGGDNSRDYKYQDNLWLSFMIGYNFAR
jgi:hypothetical protein